MATWSCDIRCGIAGCGGVVCVVESVAIRFRGGADGHDPLSSIKPNINNNKNNIVVQQCGGVTWWHEAAAETDWWSMIRRLELGSRSDGAWLGGRKSKTGKGRRENGGGKHHTLDFVHTPHLLGALQNVPTTQIPMTIILFQHQL